MIYKDGEFNQFIDKIFNQLIDETVASIADIRLDNGSDDCVINSKGEYKDLKIGVECSVCRRKGKLLYDIHTTGPFGQKAVFAVQWEPLSLAEAPYDEELDWCDILNDYFGCGYCTESQSE